MRAWERTATGRAYVKRKWAEYRKTPANRKAAIIRNKRYYARHRRKCIAHTLVYQAIKKGTLSKQPCEVCGNTTVHAHHEDYSQPLNVRWLCQTHHYAEHAKLMSFSTANGTGRSAGS